MTSHLGDEDTVIPSTYSEVFANPTMLASWSAILGTPAAVSGRADRVFGWYQSNSGAVAAAKWHRRRAGNQSLRYFRNPRRQWGGQIRSAYRPLPSCSAMRLASSLSLSVPDLILWIALADGSPFGGAPADTLEFLRRLAVLRGRVSPSTTSIICCAAQSASQSALAFYDGAVDRLVANDSRLDRQGGRGQSVGVDLGYQRHSECDDPNHRDRAHRPATSTTADVVAPALARTGILPLDSATITTLLAQTEVVPTEFPALIAAFTQVAKAAALFTAWPQARQRSTSWYRMRRRSGGSIPLPCPSFPRTPVPTLLLN